MWLVRRRSDGQTGGTQSSRGELSRKKNIMEDKFCFAIDRGGTFTDVYSRCPGGRVRVLKLLSEDPTNYDDAPTEGIRRVLEMVRQ